MPLALVKQNLIFYFVGLGKGPSSCLHGAGQCEPFACGKCKTLQPPVIHRVRRGLRDGIVTEFDAVFKRITTKWKLFSLFYPAHICLWGVPPETAAGKLAVMFSGVLGPELQLPYDSGFAMLVTFCQV